MLLERIRFERELERIHANVGGQQARVSAALAVSRREQFDRYVDQLTTISERIG